MSTITKTSSSSSSTTISEEDGNDNQLRRGPWTVEEDNLLIYHISSHGEGRWNSVAKHSGLKRTGKSCRLRWLNYLKPDVKRGNLTPQEQLLILELHSKLGNRWSKIAQYLPGRTDNEIKNYWRTRVQKQARHLKIDSNSATFQEIIRCVWMPRLLQKINGSDASFLPTQHKISPPQQVHDQFPLDGSNSTSNLDHQFKNSSSDSIDSCSDQSVNISSTLELITDQPTCDNLFYGMGQSDHNNTLMKGCYNLDNTFSFDMETLNQTSSSAMAYFSQPIHDCHVAESNWNIDDDVAYGQYWNMDELWELQDRAT